MLACLILEKLSLFQEKLRKLLLLISNKSYK